LRRAVGARTGDIRLQFLIETASTTLAGGSIGIALGFVLSQWAGQRMHLEGIEIWSAVIPGIGASLLTGLIAGLAPAMRAARMRPVEALR
jgi:putative ABC transport system permease protein